MLARESWPLLTPIAGAVRKCRWCPFTQPRTPKGAAELWRHVRQEHATEDWSVGARAKKKAS